MFTSYINPKEREAADKQLPKLLTEGLIGGSGLGILALIFEIAADAFSVAAYQTLLAIHGASGYHRIAIYAFMLLSALLFLGIVPAYKAGAYLRPNAGGSGPLVEAIGPPRMRWLSWIGTSLFFVDAILTIIISSISAADVTMLIYPELSDYRILLAEIFAFFIMAVLVAVGPKRAVPLFLIGGGAFTIFTIGALTLVSTSAFGNPEWAILTEGIVARLEARGVVEEVVRRQEQWSALGRAAIFSLFFKSMSSAMLGFSGYEVIPASGKHAARPKWKVINTSLTLAAVFLIGTGVMQLMSAARWDIPATEGYSTLLIEYEIVASELFGNGVADLDPGTLDVTEQDFADAEHVIEVREEHYHGEGEYKPDDPADVARDIAYGRAVQESYEGTVGAPFLLVAGVLLAIILLLAQGGGYVGGSAVATNAAKLGRLPSFFADDRVGIAVIWGIAAILIPIIREVVIVESYYAFGFVSAFVITSTTVYFVRNDVLIDRGIEPGSAEAKSLRFAGLRGMIASYFMLVVLITQKFDALLAIVIFGTILTLYQMYVAKRKFGFKGFDISKLPTYESGSEKPRYEMGEIRAHDDARMRGVVDATDELVHDADFMRKYNVEPDSIRTLISHVYNVDKDLFIQHPDHHHGHDEEPSVDLEATYQKAYQDKDGIFNTIEEYSDYGIFTFVNNFHANWVDEEHGRSAETVIRVMLDLLYPYVDEDIMWAKYCQWEPKVLPEPTWQFARDRYMWAKDQWPNLSDRLTTIWTLQELGLISSEIDIRNVISVADGRQRMEVIIPKEKGQKASKEQIEEDE